MTRRLRSTMRNFFRKQFVPQRLQRHSDDSTSAQRPRLSVTDNNKIEGGAPVTTDEQVTSSDTARTRASTKLGGHDHEVHDNVLDNAKHTPHIQLPTSSGSSTFEGLPPELRLQIFETGLGLGDLRNAIRASPALHRQYWDTDRKPLLRAALKASLGPAVVDAWAVHTTTKIDLGPPKETEKKRIVDFITTYLELRHSSHPSIVLSDRCRTRDLIEMSRFYFTIVKPLLQYFSGFFLRNLRAELAGERPLNMDVDNDSSTTESSSSISGGSWLEPYEYGEEIDGLGPKDKIILAKDCSTYLQPSLSLSEAFRFTRAIYCVQFWCNLFGSGPSPSLGGYPRDPASVECYEMACIFHEAFEAWEVEEMLCVYEHVREIWVHLFKDMRADVLEYDKNHEGELVFFSSGHDGRDYDFFFNSLVQNAASRGLALFLNLLKVPGQDRVTRLRMVTDNIDTLLHDDLKSSASRGVIRRKYHPSGHDLLEQAQEPMHFSGDSPERSGEPPFAWWLMWRGIYSNRYGDDVTEQLRGWGYIFWDKERMIGSRARELLLQTWRGEWGRDPRTGPQL